MKNGKKFCFGILFSILIFCLYYYVCPFIFAKIFAFGLKSTNFWLRNICSLAVYALTFLCIFLIVRKDIVKQFKDFKKNHKKILNKGFNYWAYGLIVMFISNLLITSLLGSTAVNEKVTENVIFTTPFYAIPTIVFFGPFLEELVFRYGFRKSFEKEKYYALFSALVFGLLHVTTAFDSFSISEIIKHASEFLFIVPYGSLGYFFAKAYYETDNIFSSVVPHMLHNTLSVFLIIIAKFLGV